MAAAWASLTAAAQGQIQVTEVMYGPGGNDALWEWIEVRNPSAAAIDLNNWVFDDDDDSSISSTLGANIKASNGNTIVPAGGVAVLYPADELEFDAARFTSAWGSGINLIAVDGFTSLTATDKIGLWPSHAAYMADAIPGATASPRRTFANAAAALDYSVDFPSASDARSIAWNGVGSPLDATKWVESEPGDDGELGPLHEVTSLETTIASAPVNNVADLANPGIKPVGPAAAGLLITEIMFAPATPPSAGWTSTDFEWVELFNNTSAAIDFVAKPHVLDDLAGSAISEANIDEGTLAAGGVGILFNATKLTADDMATIWGGGKNYIPVTAWPQLNNGAELVAIWDDHDEYDAETIVDGARTHASAIAAVEYNTVAGMGLGWPTLMAGRSIYLNNLTANPNLGPSWTRAGTASDTLGSFNAAPLLQLVVDHPGGDVGSPGYVPGSVPVALLGDYNSNGIVDAADYTVWRNRLGSTSLPNDATPGTVDIADYNYWKSRFGATGAGSGGVATMPEPTSGLVLLIGAMIAGVALRQP